MAVSRASPPTWATARAPVPLERPLVAGIVNVTPDSFWDGGRLDSVEAAVRHAGGLLEDGADLLDVGGESSRPGAVAVTAAAEIARVVPVVREIARRWDHVPISVDTTKAQVARAALDAGAAIINDVSGLRADPELAGVIAAAGAGLVLMHSRGTLENMARYELAEYGPDPVADVLRELRDGLHRARDAAIADDAIVIDPGFGFSKRTEHSLRLLQELRRLLELGRPLLVGPSRKRFIGEAGACPEYPLPTQMRLEGSLAACVIALLNGARIFRMHDVAPTRRALDLASAVLRSGGDA